MMRAVIASLSILSLTGCHILFPEDPRLGVEPEEEFNAVKDETVPQILSRIEFGEPDPMACQNENEPFSEHLWTRGGSGQNRQATVVVCNGRMKASTLFETETEFNVFGLELQGCGDEGWSLEVSEHHRADSMKAWGEFEADYLDVSTAIKAQCPEFAEDVISSADWIKPAFNHIVTTLKIERELNGTEGADL